MPKKRRKDQYDRGLGFLDLCIRAFVFPVFRLFKTIAFEKRAKAHQHRKFLVADIIGAAGFLVISVSLAALNLFWTRPLFIATSLFIVGMLLLALAIKYIRKRIRGKYTESDVTRSLERALRKMDSTSKWYRDEDAANAELVTSLRTLDIDAAYGYKLPNGRIVDARVGNELVEGKLSPDTSETDRLIGQLAEYTRYGDKLHIVIYGRLDSDSRRRIEREISNRYLGKVFLVSLPNPRRLRAGMSI